MYLANQSNTQVYSPFGSYVVEQHHNGFDGGRRFDVPEPAVSSLARAEQTKFETVDVPPKRNGDLLSSEQAATALNLQRHYQFHCLAPTPTRLRMLLNELMGRAEANSR